MSEDQLSEITEYIIRFLLGSKANETFSNLIGYTSDKTLFSKYKIVILPSGFFDQGFYGTAQSLPQFPLPLWDDMPLLYGQPEIAKNGDTIILHADIIASTFFLISRYEETIRRNERDEHGRFPGSKSLPFRAGFLHRPVVDEYGKQLRKLLRQTGADIKEPEEKFNKIYLTHDVDQLAHYRNIRGIGGAVSRFFKNPEQTFKALQSYFLGLKYDPWFTFPFLIDENRKLRNELVETIFFIKTGGGNLQTDKPLHDIFDKNFQILFRLGKENGVKFGLHPSYQAGIEPRLITDEKNLLDKRLNQQTSYSRNHFLASREPEDMQALIDNGFTDDYTMSYADQAGFRLGTSRAVKWINPTILQLTNLTLHPLTLMDSTLSDKRYMNLTVDEAFSFSKKMIDQVKKHNGDLTLLWHNTSVEKHNGLYHRDLYLWMINYLKIQA